MINPLWTIHRGRLLLINSVFDIVDVHVVDELLLVNYHLQAYNLTLTLDGNIGGLVNCRYMIVFGVIGHGSHTIVISDVVGDIGGNCRNNAALDAVDALKAVESRSCALAPEPD